MFNFKQSERMLGWISTCIGEGRWSSEPIDMAEECLSYANNHTTVTGFNKFKAVQSWIQVLKDQVALYFDYIIYVGSKSAI